MMVRLLEPSKIALLVLAVLYAEGSISLPGTVPILSFIIKHVLPYVKRSLVSFDDSKGKLSISDFETHLAKHDSNIPGRTVWDLLVKKLWALDCSDALDTFLSDLPALLAKSRDQLLLERDAGEATEAIRGKILKTSPLGAFIRRCHFEYSNLQFQDSIAIWQDFLAYRMPTRLTFEKKNVSEGRNLLDINLSKLSIDESHPLASIMFGRLADESTNHQFQLDADDADKLLEFQVSEMQRLGGRLPEAMRMKLDTMSKAGASLPKLAHYLKFLDSWRAGDFASALDNLHRYFDYTMQSRDRTFYQYALLNLAILQADFGCHSEAIPAMQEAIATARENKDATCLNFCMSWLYHFGRTFPREIKSIRDTGILGNEAEALSFLKSRAKDAEMWSLLSTSLLSEVKLGLQRGESIAVAFEHIVKASHIGTIKSIPNIQGPTLLTKASVFSRIGQIHLAWACCEAFLECHANSAPYEDILKCTCRVAGILSQQGRYTDAESTMKNVPAHVLRVLKYHNYWRSYSDLLKLRRLLHRDDLEAASTICERLRGGLAADTDANIAFEFLEIDLLVRKGELSAALDITRTLADRSYVENNDVAVQTRLMCIKAYLFAKAGKPLKGFTVIMRAASLAYSARLLPQLWEAITHLATILLELQEFTATKSMLESIQPHVHECQDCELAARTYSLLADAHMGLAGLAEQEHSKTKQQENVNIAMSYIEASHEQWRFIEDVNGQCETLSKKARIQHWRGNYVLANDTSSQYLKIRKEFMDARGSMTLEMVD